MLWRRSEPPPFTPSTAAVPDAEALRRAALQASWQRGRWVARQRLAQRWLWWIAVRYLLPALLVFGMGAWLWLAVLPGVAHPWPLLARWIGAAEPAPPKVSAPPAAPAHRPAVVPTANPAAPEPATVTVEYSPEGEELPSPLRLQLEVRWAVAAMPAGPAASAGSGVGVEHVAESIPSLKPENWLHSKEP